MSIGSRTLPVTDWTGRWLTLLCLTLFGYALLGRGGAYIGVPPIFIGEAVLLVGMGTFALSRWQRGFLDIPAVWCLLLLIAWGLCRVLPDFFRYGVEALRDSVIWGYSAFAFLVCGMIMADPARLAKLVRRYAQFAVIFPAFVPVIWILRRFFGESLPTWPASGVPIIDVKGGDILVHLAGILAFGVAGFGGGIGSLRLVLVAGSVGVLGAFDRAGLLSFLAVFAVTLFHKPANSSSWRLVWFGVIGLVLLGVSGIRIEIPERGRDISFDQLTANVMSIGGSSNVGDLDDTKEWRLQWWGDIVDYTINGQYFWTGKGFGFSLAEDDGYYDGVQEPTLRSPHNAHLTMLARGGVPGLALWVLVQLSWVCGILGAYFQSRRQRDPVWPDLFMFLFAYWLAFMINASFDVFLEGPMGGVWFWTVYGVGLASMWLYRYCPTALEEDPTVESTRSKSTHAAIRM